MGLPIRNFGPCSDICLFGGETIQRSIDCLEDCYYDQDLTQSWGMEKNNIQALTMKCSRQGEKEITIRRCQYFMLSVDTHS